MTLKALLKAHPELAPIVEACKALSSIERSVKYKDAPTGLNVEVEGFALPTIERSPDGVYGLYEEEVLDYAVMTIKTGKHVVIKSELSENFSQHLGEQFIKRMLKAVTPKGTKELISLFKKFERDSLRKRHKNDPLVSLPPKVLSIQWLNADSGKIWFNDHEPVSFIDVLKGTVNK